MLDLFIEYIMKNENTPFNAVPHEHFGPAATFSLYCTTILPPIFN